jgi:hypothetical protein
MITLSVITLSNFNCIVNFKEIGPILFFLDFLLSIISICVVLIHFLLHFWKISKSMTAFRKYPDVTMDGGQYYILRLGGLPQKQVFLSRLFIQTIFFFLMNKKGNIETPFWTHIHFNLSLNK